ncbi:MAG: FAD-binding oxidoreductase, partial [Nannocystaceae bacterium]
MWARLKRQLIDIVGEQRVLSEGDELAFYGTDRCRGDWSVDPRAIVFPANVEQIREIVLACGAAGVAIVPSGGRTGLAGAATATAGEVVVSLARMTTILEVDSQARLVHSQAGATVEAIQRAAEEAGLMYPVDFAAKGSAQIGGSVATNAGGVKVVRYGLTRDWVAGLKVVLASGEVVTLGGKLVKNNTGYDLRQLMIGSEGTLGIIAEVTMRLCRPPHGLEVALCGVPDDASILQLFARLRASGLDLTAFECMDHRCLEHVVAHQPRGLP